MIRAQMVFASLVILAFSASAEAAAGPRDRRAPTCDGVVAAAPASGSVAGPAAAPANPTPVRQEAPVAPQASSAPAAAPEPSAPAIEVTPIWDQPDAIGDPAPEVLRGIAIWELSKYVGAQRTLPTLIELIDKLDRDYRRKGYEREQWTEFFVGEEGNIDRLLALAVAHAPGALDELADKLVDVAGKLVRETFRSPTIADVAREARALKGSQESKERLVRALLSEDDLISLVFESDPDLLGQVTNDLVTAFTRAAFQTDVPRTQRTIASHPTTQQILDALVRPQGHIRLAMEVIGGRYGVAELQGLIERIFGDVSELERLAKYRNRVRFNSYRPGWATLERMEQLRALLEVKSGFLVTSVNAGIPVDKAQLATMLALAEERDVPIVVIPTAQILDEIDESLLHNPRIFILTHTIANSRLNVSNIGILPKNINPDAGLIRRRQFRTGQTKIVGSPQVSLTAIPTGLNHISGTFLWSPGSISLPLYPSALPVQLRTAEIAKNNHTNAFLIVEKADSRAGLNGDGAANSFHVRQVELANHPDDDDIGFTDLGRRYFVRRGDESLTVLRGTQGPRWLVRGDFHDPVSNQRFVLAQRQFIVEFNTIRVVIDHDSLDGESHRHWDFEDIQHLSDAAAAGRLSVGREYQNLVASTNALLSIRPDIISRHVVSNHPRWMIRLLATGRFPQYLEVLNKPLLDELRTAGSIYGVRDPLVWFFNRRNRWLDSLDPDIQARFAGVTRILDPDRVILPKLGDPYAVGPRHRQTQLEQHGDKGANGARGSPNAHSAGADSSVTGDSHVIAIRGSWMNVGTSTDTRLPFSTGGYSAWSHALAPIYPDGTKQLLVYQGHVATLYQRPENGVLPPDQFFGDDRFTVRENDNDVLPDTVVIDQNAGWYRSWHRLMNRFSGE